MSVKNFICISLYIPRMFHKYSIYIPQNFSKNSRSGCMWKVFKQNCTLKNIVKVSSSSILEITSQTKSVALLIFSPDSYLRVNVLHRGPLSAEMCTARLQFSWNTRNHSHNILISSIFAHSMKILFYCSRIFGILSI